MRVTNFKTRFLKNGSSDHFGTNVPDLGSSSILLGYKSPSYDFSKKFKVLLGRCELESNGNKVWQSQRGETYLKYI